MVHFHPYPTATDVIERPTGALCVDPRHAAHVPAGQVHIPQTSIFYNLEVAARRYPDKPAVQFYGAAYTYGQLLRDVEHMAAYLQQVCGIQRGDRVVVFSQNCPQFIAAYYAILRADAVLVPANAMLLLEEMEHIVSDSGATVAFVGQELVAQIAPLVGKTCLEQVIVHAYGDALGADDGGLNLPHWLRPRSPASVAFAGGVLWNDALAQARMPAPHLAGPDDLCMLPYTSGTTGKPKACVHTHRTVMTSFVGSSLWRPTNLGSVFLAVAPLFHLLGLQTNVNAAIYNASTIVLMARWDREIAVELIERHGVTFWAALPSMLVDFFSQPGIEQRDLSSLAIITGGGAATPQHISDLLKDRYGLEYIEGYGLTETASFLCTNPLGNPKRGCLGIPTFGAEVRVVDPQTLQPVEPGEVGEIIAHAAQIMLGYWNNDNANADAFVVIDGKRFLRTGDLACIDEDGYLHMRDRLKRMINASGYKVWPAEIEAMLGSHPAVLEACVIAVPDKQRGETVKAVVTLRSGATDSIDSLLSWCRENMATYKAPRIVEIVDSLPKNATGKIAWRELQAREQARAGA
ncbi:long-chain-fatty-acid--CoA ligase [Pseudomonas sp. NPDC090755]|uniref:long-chain-fatty-acid--CoA ligase n=1 Tax=Pseudomonas sp. NPDC090755 TaxID=3364481 RepID=UPI00383B391E